MTRSWRCTWTVKPLILPNWLPPASAGKRKGSVRPCCERDPPGGKPPAGPSFALHCRTAGHVAVVHGTAVLPQVTSIWHANLSLGSWLTIAVQIGFATGAITFALFNVPDIFSPI